MTVQALLLILLGVVLVFGLGVVFVNRARGGAGPGVIEPPARPQPPRPAGPPPGRVISPPAMAAGAPELDALAELEEAIEEQAEAEAAPIAPEEYVPARFRDRLTKARAAFTGAFGAVRGRAKITEETYEDLEEALLKADVGVQLTMALLDELRATVKARKIASPDELLEVLKAELKDRLGGLDRTLNFVPGPEGSPNVWLFVGVNGVGKTTTIGKLAAQQIHAGRTVVLAAGDTFRAAAAEQLQTWAERSGADFVRGNEGGDPSAVIFDGVQRASARKADLVLGDTAGRLHTKTNLMDELRKVRRIADRDPGRVTEVLLVLDATTGQNGLVQAREFTEATQVTGVVLTKLDGSAKGGIVLAIQQQLGIPVKLVGLGEQLGDLVEFDPDEFVDALFDDSVG